jgi:hypothetical protein
MEPHKSKPGQSGNPNGRPLKALAQISIDKELGNQPCPEKIWKEIERQVPGCFPKNRKPPTWLQCEVVKNRIKAMSLRRGDAMAIARWQIADRRPRIQVSGPGRRAITIPIARSKKADRRGASPMAGACNQSREWRSPRLAQAGAGPIIGSPLTVPRLCERYFFETTPMIRERAHL